MNKPSFPPSPSDGAKPRLTREELIGAIRRATSLDDLKRLVGPSIDDQVAAQLRKKATEMLLARHGSDPASWPDAVQRTLAELAAQQADYLRLYGE